MYYIKPMKNGYQVINLSTHKVERSFHVTNIYTIVNALLNDLYIQYGTIDAQTNTLIAPNKKFSIYLNEWVAIDRLNNPFRIAFHIEQVKGEPALKYEQLCIA